MILQFPSSKLDWPEDFPHENGQYVNRCAACSNSFIGHKRRICCKVCADRSNERRDAMTPAEREAQDSELARALAEIISESHPSLA